MVQSWYNTYSSWIYSQGLLLVTFYEWDEEKTDWIKHDKYYILLHVSLRLDTKHQVEILTSEVKH